MKIRTILIDDEQANINNLQGILTNFFPEVEVVATAMCVEDGIQVIREHQPELVFLDIEMPDGTGIELLNKLGRINFDTVFVTGHRDYAVEAFRLSAVDYLLKPIDLQDLEECFEKIKAKHNDRKRLDRLETFVENYTPASGAVKKIPLSSADKLEFVPINEVIRCEGQQNYTTFHLTTGRRIVVSKNLKEYELMLNHFDFIRTHQSHLVNQEHISTYIKTDGGYLKMVDGSDVPVARSRKELVLSKLSRF